MAHKKSRDLETAASADTPQLATDSVRPDGADVLIAVRAKPRAHADSIEPEKDGAWPVSVRAAPSEGAANAAVLVLVARALERPASTCSVHRGRRGRDKVVRAAGLDAETARAKLQRFASVSPSRAVSRRQDGP
jgi:uncharacterized protein YggU (UPF0235/DUF167 family)